MADAGFHRVQNRDFLALVVDLQLLETAGLGEDLTFERAHELVVLADSAVERLADALHMAAHDGEALVEFLAKLGDFVGVAGLVFHPPTIGDGLAQAEQRGGRHQQDALFHGLGHQVGRALQRGHEEAVAGDKHRHEIGRLLLLELIPVGLAGQPRNVLAQAGGVPVQRRGAHLLVGRVLGFEIGGQRAFGVDHELAPAGQMHDHVGAERRLTREVILLGEVVFGIETGHVEHVAQRLFAPAALHACAAAECGRQLARLGLRLFGRLHQRVDLGLEAADVFRALLLEIVHMLLETLQRVGHRLELGAQLFAVDLLAVGAALLLLLAQVSQGGTQRLAGLGGESLLHIFQRLVCKLGLGADGSDLGDGLAMFGAQRGELVGQPGVGGALVRGLGFGGGEFRGGGGFRLPGSFGAGAQLRYFARAFGQFGGEMRRIGRLALPEHEGCGGGNQCDGEQDDVQGIDGHTRL